MFYILKQGKIVNFLYFIFMYIFIALITVDVDNSPISTIIFKMIVVLIGFIIAMQFID